MVYFFAENKLLTASYGVHTHIDGTVLLLAA